ncbi:MAG TPA: PEP-CTERM sorting domain-containing protein [Bryobacteraceae bacterium]|jgi:hypothetical protein|nr:PEP-CTERM sorting domain-containing protein [Bryobacteraceae bacterium]
MKTILCFALISVAAKATIIYVDSEAANTINNSGQPTVDLAGTLHPNPGWATAVAGSDWISDGSTGEEGDPGYFSPPDGTVVTFTTQFTLIGAITAGSLVVLADDCASVVLNGQELIGAVSICPRAQTVAEVSAGGVFTFADLSPYLVDGTNTLSFSVVQVGGSSFGLDFAGKIDDGADTPEPATVAFFGIGLMALTFLRRRK